MKHIRMAMLVLSCDKFSPLWNDFFNLRDKFWGDCPYPWFVVTETKSFDREDVEVIKCGKGVDWAGRFRMAVQYVDADYIGLFLDDFFISSKVDTPTIESLLDLMDSDNVCTINVGNVFGWITRQQPTKEYYKDHLIKIPAHLRWGLSTESTIWNKGYLLDTLGDGDYSAWQFEIDRCKQAETELGIPGLNLCDDRLPFKVSTTPVVIQGEFYPDAIRKFHKIGYDIDTSGFPVMGRKKVFMYKLKCFAAEMKHGKKILKWIGTHVFGLKFFSDTL